MCSILFEGGTYACAQNNPWSTRIKNKHNKIIKLFLRHKLHITACIADRNDNIIVYRFLKS